LINGKRNLNIDLERSVWTEEWRDKSRRYKDLFQYLSLRICILAGSIIFFSTEMLFKAGEISLENNSLNTYQKVVLLSLSDVAASVTACKRMIKHKTQPSNPPKDYYCFSHIDSFFVIHQYS